MRAAQDWQDAAVAVSGLSAADNPAPGVAVARSLREAGHRGRLVGLAYETTDAGLYHRELFDEIWMIPWPSQGGRPLLERLGALAQSGGLDAVLPTLDSEMDLYLSLRPELRALGIGSFLPDERGLALRAKTRIAAFCEEHGVPAPTTRSVVDFPSLARAWEELSDAGGRRPVYVKGVFYEARPAWTLEQAQAAFLDISARWGLPILLQRGLAGFEYNVCCLGDGRGGLIGAVPMRKLGVTDKGKAWSGVSVRNPELLRLTERLIAALDWRGPCELEILCGDEDGALHLIEINPRFPAWCYLCAGAGQNLPAAQLQLALGAELAPLPPARSGVIYSRAAIDIICDLAVLEELSLAGRADYRSGRQGGRDGTH
jgi:carbamoyl-phosphate synthase large subunit